jgi:hypothetical protein
VPVKFRGAVKPNGIVISVEMRLKVKTESIIAVSSMLCSDFQSLKIALDFLESQKNIRKP